MLVIKGTNKIRNIEVYFTKSLEKLKLILKFCPNSYLLSVARYSKGLLSVVSKYLWGVLENKCK